MTSNKSNNNNNNNQKGNTTMSYDPNNCQVDKTGNGDQCQHNQKAKFLLDNGRRVCGVHYKAHEAGKELSFMTVPPKQEQLITTLEPEASIPKGISPAHRVAAQFGLQKASDLLNEIDARGGLVAQAYINKIPKEDHTMTMPIDVHGDHGQPNPRYEREVADMQQELEDNKDFVIAGSGTRKIWGNKDKMREVHTRLVEVITKAEEKHGTNLVVMSGMAQGFDFVLAKAAMEVGVRLHLAIPNTTYLDYYWGKEGQERHWANQVLEYAESVVYVTGSRYGRQSMMDRNTYMVESCDVMWVYDPSSAGTADTYRKVKKANKRHWLVPVV